MMNKLQDLMEKEIPIEVIIDTGDEDGHYNSIRGTIKNVGRDYVEISRGPYQDEKSRYNVDEVRTIVPMSRIAEINCYLKK
ncbi:hypothetical protein EU527_18025 [Candidatus Thorarchaeota archaeon]|nr:MAG: hypothetical protein EU527_18025 [Candidatus Thorarchaeota archaeon]